MLEQEVTDYLLSQGFRKDTESSALDGYTFARYTFVDNRGLVYHANLHKEPDNSIVANLDRFNINYEKELEGVVAEVHVERRFVGVRDMNTLQAVMKSLRTRTK